MQGPWQPTVLQQVHSLPVHLYMDNSPHLEQLTDILALHVLPLLQARDAQALGHSCSALRNLISTGLPSSTWTSIAANTFPAAHPVLAANARDVPKQLQQLAGVRAALSSGRLATATELSLRSLILQRFPATPPRC